jgi:hypothetical protein
VLIPEVATGAAAELQALRNACDLVVLGLTEAAPDRIVVLGGSDHQTLDEVVAHAAGAVGSLSGYGVDLRLVLGEDDATSEATLPLSLTIGAWLLGRAHWDGGVVGLELPLGAGPAVGLTLAEMPARIGLLVIGDGSARLSPGAPGYVHPDGRHWQDEVNRALGQGDAQALLSLDPGDQLAGGCAAWRVAAAPFAKGSVQVLSSFVEERYGVGYVVALWVPR